MSDLTTILRIMGMPRCIEAADEIERLTAALAKSVSAWQPIETAPRDGTPIVGWCQHSADPYWIDDGRLTDYGANAEGLSHVEDGHHVLVWVEAYDASDGWESPRCTIPAWWQLSSNCEVAANPTHWMPLPPPPQGV